MQISRRPAQKCAGRVACESGLLLLLLLLLLRLLQLTGAAVSVEGLVVVVEDRRVGARVDLGASVALTWTDVRIFL